MTDPYTCNGTSHEFMSTSRRRWVWPADPDYERAKGQPFPDGRPARDLVVHRDDGDLRIEIVDYQYTDTDEELETLYDPFEHDELGGEVIEEEEDPFAIDPSDDPFDSGNPVIDGRPTRKR